MNENIGILGKNIGNYKNVRMGGGLISNVLLT